MAHSTDDDLSYVQVFQNCFGPKLTSVSSSSKTLETTRSNSIISSPHSTTLTVLSSSPLSSPTHRGSRSAAPVTDHYGPPRSHLPSPGAYGNSTSACHPPHGKWRNYAIPSFVVSRFVIDNGRVMAAWRHGNCRCTTHVTAVWIQELSSSPYTAIESCF